MPSVLSRPPGAPAEALDVVDMQSLLALPQESLQQKTVRVVRGSEVSEVTFGNEETPLSRNEAVADVRLE